MMTRFLVVAFCTFFCASVSVCTQSINQDQQSFTDITISDDEWFDAINKRDLDKVRKYLSAKCKARTNDKNGFTGLMIAARNGYTEIVELLANHEAKMLDNRDRTALMYAAEYGHIDAVRILLDYECGIKYYQRSSLALAAGNGHVEIVKLLAEKEHRFKNDAICCALDNQYKDYGKDNNRYIDIAQFLITSGLDIQCTNGSRDYQGQTALMAAAKNGCTEIARLLVDKQAGYRGICEFLCVTALMYAAYYGHVEIAKILADRECGMIGRDGRNALGYAAWRGHIEIVKMLMDKECQLADGCGATALMYAAYNDNIEIAKLLLHRQCRRQNLVGKTALMITVSCSSPYKESESPLVRLLMDEEAGMQDNVGRTALMYAAFYHRDADVGLLISKEAGVKDNFGRTALMYAAMNDGGVASIRSLVNCNKEVGVQDYIGHTALMYAAKAGNIKIVQLLLKKKAA